MNRHQWTMGLAIAAGLAAAAASTAALGGGTAAVQFRGLDSNADGVLSRDEVGREIALSERFDALDQDRNGRLTLVEFAAFETGADTTPDRPAIMDGGAGAAGSANPGTHPTQPAKMK